MHHQEIIDRLNKQIAGSVGVPKNHTSTHTSLGAFLELPNPLTGALLPVEMIEKETFVNSNP